MKEFIIVITMFFAEPNTYPNAVTVKSMFCVEKENGFTGV